MTVGNFKIFIIKNTREITISQNIAKEAMDTIVYFANIADDTYFSILNCLLFLYFAMSVDMQLCSFHMILDKKNN